MTQPLAGKNLFTVTLDTPMNRKWMPKADTSTWTPLEWVADLMLKWSTSNQVWKKTFPFFSPLFVVSKQAKTQYIFPLPGLAEPQWKPVETGDRKVGNKISS